MTFLSRVNIAADSTLSLIETYKKITFSVLTLIYICWISVFQALLH